MRDESGKAAPSRSISLLPSLSPSLGDDFCRFLAGKAAKSISTELSGSEIQDELDAGLIV